MAGLARMAAAATAFLVAFGISLERPAEPAGNDATAPALIIGAASAHAAEVHGVARRTARRTTRRVVRRTTLPANCARSGAFYFCGGVYYQPVVEGGTTVYIVVNP